MLLYRIGRQPGGGGNGVDASSRQPGKGICVVLDGYQLDFRMVGQEFARVPALRHANLLPGEVAQSVNSQVTAAHEDAVLGCVSRIGKIEMLSPLWSDVHEHAIDFTAKQALLSGVAVGHVNLNLPANSTPKRRRQVHYPSLDRSVFAIAERWRIFLCKKNEGLRLRRRRLGRFRLQGLPHRKKRRAC